VFGVSFKASLKSNFCTDLPTQNTTRNNRVNSHTQNTTALQPNEFSIAMHRLLVINKVVVGFPQRKPFSRSTANFAVTVYKCER